MTEPSTASPGSGAPASAPRARSGAVRRRTRTRRVLLWTLPLAVVLVIGLALGAGVAATIHVPEVESITDYSPDLVTELLDDQGTAYRDYYRENRILLEEGEVPDVVRKALVSFEDKNFYRHGGIDAVGIARAALRNVLGRHEGASTLTMQLAGTLFLDRTQRTGWTAWKRKIGEALRAVELEKQLSKEQILTLYANVMNLGHGNYGFEAASRFYFGKSVKDLTVDEAALLVAIIKRPSDWSPIRRPDFMLQRRNLVLRAMFDEGYLSAEELAEAKARPLGLASREHKVERGAFFAEEVRRSLYETYGERGVYERGLKVHTTYDARIQLAAEQALEWGLMRIDRMRGWRGAPEHLDEEGLDSKTLPSWDHLSLTPGLWVKGLVLAADARRATVKVAEQTFNVGAEEIAWTRRTQPSSLLERGDVAWFIVRSRDDEAKTPYLELAQEPELEGAAVVLESGTGAVRALVGGWDYSRNEFNRATQARRQVGSAFKPFVYGAAFEDGYTPADTLFDAPAVFLGADNLPSYSPRNFYRKYEGIVTLRHALEKSLNVTAVKLQDLVGVDKVIDFARRCGLTSPLGPYPTLALGAVELTPLELTAAYATFPNQGLYVEPYLVDNVATADGRVIEQHRTRTNQALDPKIAYLVTHTLEGVSQRGTAASLARLPVTVAGKTGTTDGFTDAWFVGFTPRYTITVWVGFDRKRTIGRNMTGAEAALPIWTRILESGMEEGWIDAEQRFVAPPGIVFRRVEASTGLLASGNATHTIYEAFVAGTEPVQEYSPRWQRVMELPWYQQRAFYGKPKVGENMPEDIADWSLVKNVQDDEESGG